MFTFHPKWIFLPCLGFVLLSSKAYCEEPSKSYEESTMQIPGIEKNLEILFAQHGRLLTAAIIAALNNVPQDQADSVKERLMTNSRQIASLLTTVYGLEVGKTFENLFNEHIHLGSQYINAVKLNNQKVADQISQQALDNGESLATFFSQLNSTIPNDTWQKMWAQHVKIEADQTQAYFQRNTQKAMESREKSLSQLKELADLTASAILKTPQQGRYAKK